MKLLRGISNFRGSHFIKFLLIITSCLFLFGFYYFYGKPNLDNFLIAYVTFLLALVGYWQLDKLNRGNAMQLLFHFEEEWYSDEMKKNRELFARLICNKIDEGTDFINFSDTSPEWTRAKIIIEDVIDFFEKLAHFTKMGDFPFESVYSLYSYYIQGYWELCASCKYMERLSKQPDGDDFYEDFKWLYNKLMKDKELHVFKQEDLLRLCAEEKMILSAGEIDTTMNRKTP